MTKRMRILIDLDNVLADFTSKAYARLGYSVLEVEPKINGSTILRPLVPGVNFSHPHGREIRWKEWGFKHPGDFWNTLGENFFYDLNPMYDFNRIMSAVKSTGCEWYIATSPTRTPKCASGKVHWMQHQFGVGFRDFMIGPPKYLMANSRTILIDDNAENIEKFRKNGGIGFLYPRVWNPAYKSLLSEEVHGMRTWLPKNTASNRLASFLENIT